MKIQFKRFQSNKLGVGVGVGFGVGFGVGIGIDIGFGRLVG